MRLSWPVLSTDAGWQVLNTDAESVAAAIDAGHCTIVTLTSERDQPSQEERGSRGHKPEPLPLPALASRPEAAAVRALDGAPHHAYRTGAPARDGPGRMSERRVWCCWVPETCRWPARRHHELFRAAAGLDLGYSGRALRHTVPSTADSIDTPLARHPDGYLFYVRRCVLPEPTILAGFARRRLVRHGIGTPLARQRDACWRRLVGVYLGLPATAAVADMPVGTPSPFASALEQAPDRTRTARQQRPGSVSTSRSRPVLIPPSRRVRPRQES